MALMTQDQVRTAVQQAFDDAGANRWSAANLDLVITLAQDTLWQQVLDTYPYYLSASEAETSDGSGIIAISALTTPGRMYRIQRILLNSDSSEIFPVLPYMAVPTSQTYYILGGNIVSTEAGVAHDVIYAGLPTKFNALATGATVLDSWPEGHEAALIYASAAWAISKGDAESMQQIARLADHAVEAMLDHIARRYPVAVERRGPAVKFSTIRNPILGVSGPEVQGGGGAR